MLASHLAQGTIDHAPRVDKLVLLCTSPHMGPADTWRDRAATVREQGTEAIVDAMVGLAIKSPAGPVTIGSDHHATMSMFLARTQGRDLVPVRALGEITPEPGCKMDAR